MEILIDTIFDGIKLLPFLFITFLIIECFEHKMSTHTKEMLAKKEKLGPFLGSTLGLFPQCGFSVAATNLYITKIISLGTLISVYLATSDEMLPVLLSEGTSGKVVLQLLGIKWIVGIFMGVLIDLLWKKKNENYEICDHDHCHCEEGHIFRSSLYHTLQTFFFIFVTTFVLNTLFAYFGEETLQTLFLKDSLLAPFLSSFVGLIPNCGASIMLTELFLKGMITMSTCLAGLLTGSGVALLVLAKNNQNKTETCKIIGLLYGIGTFTGVLLYFIGI